MGGPVGREGMVAEGKFDISAGQYEFWTNSDDGSRLYLRYPDGNRRLIVDNWGTHGGVSIEMCKRRFLVN
jgi:hypothetical protein